MSQASNLLRALNLGGDAGTIGAAPLVLNLSSLGLDARPWFLGVESASDCTISVEISWDSGANYYPASPASVAAGQYETFNFLRSPGETYPNRVRLTRTAGALTSSTYALGPVGSISVAAQGRFRRIAGNAPGRDIGLGDIGGVITCSGASNSTFVLPADGSAKLGGKSWMAGGTLYPCFGLLRIGNGELFLQPELDASFNSLVTIDFGSTSLNDRQLCLVAMVDLNHWVVT